MALTGQCRKAPLQIIGLVEMWDHHADVWCVGYDRLLAHATAARFFMEIDYLAIDT